MFERWRKVFLLWIFTLILTGAIVESAAAGNLVIETPTDNPYIDPVTGDPTLIEFVNGSFEIPNIETDTIPGAYSPASPGLQMNLIPGGYSDEFGWQTEPVHETEHEYKNHIEMRRQNREIHFPADGAQFVELNGDVEGRLYQYCATIPGQKVYYQYHHKGREGVDTMNFYLSAPGETVLPLKTSSTDNDRWVKYAGVYTVPAGQTVTEFAFESVAAAGGDIRMGNYLDAIELSYPSFLELDLSVMTPRRQIEGLSSELVLTGETIEYSIEVYNNGESTSSRTVLTNIFPEGIRYIADSVYIDGTKAETLATYDSLSDMLRINIGAGAAAGNNSENGGSIPKGGNVTVTFQAEVVGGGAVELGDEIFGQVKVSYNDQGFETLNSNIDDTNVSNPISFILASPIRIQIQKKIDQNSVESEGFTFLVEYRPSEIMPVEKVFYTYLEVDDDNAFLDLAEMMPGYYTITEIESNWIYQIDSPGNISLSEVLDGISIIGTQFTFHNKQIPNNLISGNNNLINRMKQRE